MLQTADLRATEQRQEPRDEERRTGLLGGAQGDGAHRAHLIGAKVRWVMQRTIIEGVVLDVHTRQGVFTEDETFIVERRVGRGRASG